MGAVREAEELAQHGQSPVAGFRRGGQECLDVAQSTTAQSFLLRWWKLQSLGLEVRTMDEAGGLFRVMDIRDAVGAMADGEPVGPQAGPGRARGRHRAVPDVRSRRTAVRCRYQRMRAAQRRHRGVDLATTSRR
jgi:hypothetical protein